MEEKIDRNRFLENFDFPPKRINDGNDLVTERKKTVQVWARMPMLAPRN